MCFLCCMATRTWIAFGGLLFSIFSCFVLMMVIVLTMMLPHMRRLPLQSQSKATSQLLLGAHSILSILFSLQLFLATPHGLWQWPSNKRSLSQLLHLLLDPPLPCFCLCLLSLLLRFLHFFDLLLNALLLLLQGLRKCIFQRWIHPSCNS